MARRVWRAVRETGGPLAELPRERLLANGPNTLSSTELLAVVLAGGSASGSAANVAIRLMGEHAKSCQPGTRGSP